MKKPRLSRLLAEIDEELHKEVKIAAIREGVSVKSLLEKSLMQYLSHKSKAQAKAA